MPDRDAEDACAMSDADDLQKAIHSACDAYETDAETDAIKHFCAILEQAPEPATLAGVLARALDSDGGQGLQDAAADVAASNQSAPLKRLTNRAGFELFKSMAMVLHIDEPATVRQDAARVLELTAAACGPRETIYLVTDCMMVAVAAAGVEQSAVVSSALLDHLQQAVMALKSPWAQLRSLMPAVLGLLEVVDAQDQDSDEENQEMQVIKPVGNVLTAKGLAQIPPVTSFIASFTSIAETAEQKAELMHYVFALCESAVLSAEAARYESLSAVAVLLIELGFDFNFVSRTYTALQKIERAKQQEDFDNQWSDSAAKGEDYSSSEEEEDPFCVDYSQYNDAEDKADTSVDQSQLMIGLALMACATDLEGQRVADQFFGEGLWDASYLMLVTCTFAAHGISTTMDEGLRRAAIQLVHEVSARVPRQTVVALEGSSDEVTPLWFSVSQTLVNAVATSPSANFFSATENMVANLMGCLTDQSKFFLTQRLLKVTHGHAKMVVLHAFKKDMTARSRSWEAESPVISVKCFDMLAKELQKEADPRNAAEKAEDAAEVITSFLAIFLFCLMKDKNKGHVRGLWNYVKDDSLESSVVQPIRDFIISAQHQAVGSEAEEDDEEAEATEAAPLSNVVLACMRIEHSLENLEQRVRVMKDEWSNA